MTKLARDVSPIRPVPPPQPSPSHHHSSRHSVVSNATGYSSVSHRTGRSRRYKTPTTARERPLVGSYDPSGGDPEWLSASGGRGSTTHSTRHRHRRYSSDSGGDSDSSTSSNGGERYRNPHAAQGNQSHRFRRHRHRRHHSRRSYASAGGNHVSHAHTQGSMHSAHSAHGSFHTAPVAFGGGSMQAGGSFYGSPAHPAALAAAVATSHMSYTNGSFVGGQQLQVAQPGHGYGAGGGYGHGHSTSYDNSQRTVTHGSVAGNMSATGGTDLDAAIAASAQEFYVDGPGHVRRRSDATSVISGSASQLGPRAMARAMQAHLSPDDASGPLDVPSEVGPDLSPTNRRTRYVTPTPPGGHNTLNATPGSSLSATSGSVGGGVSLSPHSRRERPSQPQRPAGRRDQGSGRRTFGSRRQRQSPRPGGSVFTEAGRVPIASSEVLQAAASVGESFRSRHGR